MKLINIGFGNMISADRLIAIVSPESARLSARFRKRVTATCSLMQHMADARAQSLLWTATTLCCLRFCRRPFREEWTAAVQRRKKSMSEKGILFVLTGPSGVGKGTVLKEVRAHKPLFYSISATTRAPRAGEQDGVHYHFMTRETFRQLAEQGGFLEHAEFSGNCYGTPAAPVDEELQTGRDVLLEIEVQGAMQVKDIRPEAVRIFLAPPSFEELERRLIGRGTEEPEVIQRRLGYRQA